MFWITRGTIITGVSWCRFRCVFSLILWWNNCFLLRKSRSPTVGPWQCRCLWNTNSTDKLLQQSIGSYSVIKTGVVYLIRDTGLVRVNMTAPSAPIGWSSTKMNLHFKPVTPKKRETGMYYNLHKNVKKSFLPKEVQNMETQSVDLARRILHRQRQKSLRISHDKYRQIASQGSSRFTVLSDETGLGSSNYEDLSRSLYLPPVGRPKPNTPMTPGSRYTADDVRSIVDRLSTYDPSKVPESRGQFVKLPAPIVYKKKYSEDEVQSIVDRLSDYDPLKGPAESRGIPTIVRRVPRQSMVPPQKCTSDEVEDIVERLCRVHFDAPLKEPRYVPTPYPLSARS